MSDRQKQPHLLHYDWLDSQEGKEFLGVLLRRNKRRVFGLLEQPSLPSGITPVIIPFKILLLGKSGVGKTSTVAKLAGKDIPTSYSETPGIQTTLVYWPAKLVASSKVVLFKLHLWDFGDYASKKFDHIGAVRIGTSALLRFLMVHHDPRSAKLNPDAVIFFFSFTDRSSFDDLPYLVTRSYDDLSDLAKLTIGTKYLPKFDQVLHSEVTEEELRDFQEQWNIPILKICNNEGRKLADGSLDGRAGIMEVAPILNRIIEVLWKRREETKNKDSHNQKSSKKRTPADSGNHAKKTGQQGGVQISDC